MNPTRREVLSACALAAVATAVLGTPTPAEASRAAPRRTCRHVACRHHRPGPDGRGACGLARGDVQLVNPGDSP